MATDPRADGPAVHRARAQGDTVQGDIALGTVTLEQYRRVRAEKAPVHVVVPMSGLAR